MGIFSNGIKQTVARLALANFNNPLGLKKVGNALYRFTVNSGLAQVGVAGTSGLGVLQAGAVEMPMIGRVVQCPIDEMNRPRGGVEGKARVPPSQVEVAPLFSVGERNWRPAGRSRRSPVPMHVAADGGDRVTCQRVAPAGPARHQVGSGPLREGPRPVRQRQTGVRAAEADRAADQRGRTELRWFIEDVWGQFDDDHTRPGAPLFPSERRNTDGSCARAGGDALRVGLADAAIKHLPGWTDALIPHALRHCCASQLYHGGLDLIAIQEVLGHSWIATTMHYIARGQRELHQRGGFRACFC